MADSRTIDISQLIDRRGINAFPVRPVIFGFFSIVMRGDRDT